MKTNKGGLMVFGTAFVEIKMIMKDKTKKECLHLVEKHWKSWAELGAKMEKALKDEKVGRVILKYQKFKKES